MTENPAERKSATPTAFPPAHHIVRDLQVSIDRSQGDWAIRLPIVPAILDATGRVRVGIAAVIVDMIAGQTAIREVSPAWIATSNLALQVGELPSAGVLVGRPRVLRKGSTTIVIEVGLTQSESGRWVGLSTLGFAILPRRSEMQGELARSRETGVDSIYSPAGAGFEKPLLEAMEVAFDERDPGCAEVPLLPYLQNTLGALQGGVVATLVEATAERFAAATLGGAVRVRGIELHYLKLGRVGPIRARAEALTRTPAGMLVRVALDDRGQGSDCLTVATVWIERADASPNR